jgi:acyl-CoA synthetase (AMP-forming)/AMP-acid ligase II
MLTVAPWNAARSARPRPASPGDAQFVPSEPETTVRRLEICLRSDSVVDGYLDNPEATAGEFRGGWLHTGDRAPVQPVIVAI